MERDPSLHIRRSALIKVLEEVDEWLKDEFGLTGCPDDYFERVADIMLVRAKSHSCSSRSVVASNDKILKKTEKLKLASRSNTGKFAQAILLMRRKARHRGIKLIGPGDKDWLILKDICKDATEFCNEFGFELSLGYKKYVEIGMKMMNGFSLNRFKSLQSPISNMYEAIQEIETDKYPDRTRQAHDIFMGIISSRTGLSERYLDNPVKYVHFVKAANEARSIGVSLEDYIRAQFAAFEWKSGVPEPSQIYGSKARERVMKYCYEKNISTSKKENHSGPKINFDAIKKAKRKNRS